MMKLMSREVFNVLFNVTKLVGVRVWIISRQFEPELSSILSTYLHRADTSLSREDSSVPSNYEYLISLFLFCFFRDINKESMTEVFHFTPLKNSDEIITVQDFRRGKENPIQIYETEIRMRRPE